MGAELFRPVISLLLAIVSATMMTSPESSRVAPAI
ncbi:hypothetical protein X736_31245 [Mesorhizobium sp. L2C089B000]|nr:hypothetical protein X736_31245 [Mesorhizobium sp. L2C089B000]